MRHSSPTCVSQIKSTKALATPLSTSREAESNKPRMGRGFPYELIEPKMVMSLKTIENNIPKPQEMLIRSLKTGMLPDLTCKHVGFHQRTSGLSQKSAQSDPLISSEIQSTRRLSRVYKLFSWPDLIIYGTFIYG